MTLFLAHSIRQRLVVRHLISNPCKSIALSISSSELCLWVHPQEESEAKSYGDKVMFVLVYLNMKNGQVIIPSKAETEAGFWVDVEPVEVVAIDNPASVVTALRKVCERKLRVIPTPPREALGKSIVLPYATVKTQKVFDAQYALWSLADRREGGFLIEKYKPAPSGRGNVPDPTTAQIFPVGTTLDEVIQLLVEKLQSEVR